MLVNSYVFMCTGDWAQVQANFKALGRIEIGIVIQLYAEKGEEQYLGVASLEGLCSLLFVLIIITPGKIDLLSL